MKERNVDYFLYGIKIGNFPAKVCEKCNESFTDEKTTRAMEEAARKEGIWGLGKKTKTSENHRFSGHRKSKGFSCVTKT